MITLNETIFCEPCEFIQFIGELNDIETKKDDEWGTVIVFKDCPEHGPLWVGNCSNCGEKLYNKDIC